jgi:hypothetical protein
VTGLDADRRGVQANEEQAVAKWRQVGKGLDRPAVDLDRGAVRAWPGTVGQRVEIVGDQAGRS